MITQWWSDDAEPVPVGIDARRAAKVRNPVPATAGPTRSGDAGGGASSPCTSLVLHTEQEKQPSLALDLLVRVRGSCWEQIGQARVPEPVLFWGVW